MNGLAAGAVRCQPCESLLLAASMVTVLLTVTVQPVFAQHGERSGKQVVESVCTGCHAEGLNGAPKIGDKSAWIPRLSHGLPLLLQSAIRGHGGMPPRGGVASLTDNEIRSAIIYMFYPVVPPVGTPGMSSRESGATGKNADPNYRTAGNMEIYLGIAPASRLRGFPSGSPERSMHGGVPGGENYQHVNITLLDQKRKAPITGAKVDVRVEQPNLARVSKMLEPMPFGGSYGNYVRIRTDIGYRITVNVQIPGAARPTEVHFEHEH
ncbi:MAG: hypothetical protein RLZZ445_1202 [Pseudomonadota bacterium]|jgi:cytochrome c5